MRFRYSRAQIFANFSSALRYLSRPARTVLADAPPPRA
jgi:hypothetical protein